MNFYKMLKEKKRPYLIIFDTLDGEMIAVVPESTPEHANTISLQLLEHLK